MDPQDRKGTLYTYIQFLMTTIMRCVGRLQSALAMQEMLLTDEAPSVTQKKRPDVRANNHAPKVKVTFFGWKI